MTAAHAAALLTLPLLACTGRALPGGSGTDGSSSPDGARDRGTPGDVRTAPDRGPTAPGWVTIKPGSFLMGSPDEELCRLSNEVLHPVTLSHGYEIGATEVTQGAFLQAMGYNPSQFQTCGAQCPVDSVDWNAAAVFCNRLSQELGLTRCYSCTSDGGGNYAFPYDCTVRPAYASSIYHCPGYRLPTEAEWENAYRAGSATALFNGPIGACDADAGASAIGWYGDNSGGRPHEVAGHKPNAWGLYDMAGNLWEWVNDWYAPVLGAGAAVDPVGPAAGQGKVLRGGAWVSSSGSVRGASRNQNQRFKGLAFVGFRCTRSIGN